MLAALHTGLLPRRPSVPAPQLEQARAHRSRLRLSPASAYATDKLATAGLMLATVYLQKNHTEHAMDVHTQQVKDTLNQDYSVAVNKATMDLAEVDRKVDALYANVVNLHTERDKQQAAAQQSAIGALQGKLQEMQVQIETARRDATASQQSAIGALQGKLQQLEVQIKTARRDATTSQQKDNDALRAQIEEIRRGVSAAQKASKNVVTTATQAGQDAVGTDAIEEAEDSGSGGSGWGWGVNWALGRST